MTRRRWPQSVYGEGSEPDPRFSLANERTFLAWIRTSLAFLAGAAAVDALPLGIAEWAQALLAAVLALTGLLAGANAWWRWRTTERAMRHDGALPGNGTGMIVVLGVAVAGLVLLVATMVQMG